MFSFARASESLFPSVPLCAPSFDDQFYHCVHQESVCFNFNFPALTRAPSGFPLNVPPLSHPQFCVPAMCFVRAPISRVPWGFRTPQFLGPASTPYWLPEVSKVSSIHQASKTCFCKFFCRPGTNMSLFFYYTSDSFLKFP